MQVDFGNKASCIEDFFEDEVLQEEDFDLWFLEDLWLVALLATECSFFFEEATLREFLVWRLPPMLWLALSLRSSLSEFLEEVVMTDLCAETTDEDDDKETLMEEAAGCLWRFFNSCLSAKYPGGSDLVSMTVLDAMLQQPGASDWVSGSIILMV